MRPRRTANTLRAAGVLLRIAMLGVVMLVGLTAVSAQGTSVPPKTSASAPAPSAVDATNDWPQWTTGRYRLTPSDVIQLTFPYVSEFDQTVSVQPDGYVSLKGIRDLYAQGLTVPQFEQAVVDAYASVLRDPVVNVLLKEFEKPYYIAAGEVAHPGKFELRGATTLTQALAIAGGTTKSAKSSQIILFRRFTDELLEVKTIDAKKMLHAHDLSEDALLRPGDTVFVPTTVLSQIGAFIAKPALSLYLNPFQQLP